MIKVVLQLVFSVQTSADEPAISAEVQLKKHSI